MWRKEPPTITVAKGSKGSGKTEWLINKIGQALADGAKPTDMMVMAASPTAAAALAQRIEGQLACEIEVRVPMMLAEDILRARDEAQGNVRPKRILLPHERQMLFEDLKATGMQPGRIKGMLDFFEHSWMDAKPSSEFLAYQDEVDLLEFCSICLSFYGVTLPTEVPLEALSAVEDCLDLRASFAKRVVFVDDIQLLSAASQRLMTFLAKESMFATMDPAANYPVFEKHPCNPGSVWENNLMYPDEVVTLEGPSAVVALLHDEETPDDEIGAVVARISKHTFDNPYTRIYVACPSKAWKVKVAAGLQKAKQPCYVTGRESMLVRKAADPQASAPIKAASLLVLMAKPDDSMAWRSLFACDVHLMNSAGVAALRDMFAPHGECLVEAVEAACAAEASGTLEDLLPEASRFALASVRDLVVRYRGTKIALAKLKDMKGPELVAELCKLVCPDDAAEARQLARLVAELAGGGAPLADRDAQDLAKALVSSVLYPTIPEGVKIIVGDCSEATGMSFDHVFLTGAVEGFLVPRRFYDLAETTEEKQRAEIAKRETMVYQTVGGAPSCEISSFRSLPAEDAERLGVRIRRIGVKAGVRMAAAARCEIVDPYIK